MQEVVNTSKTQIRVVIADDHKLLRHAVRDILESNSKYLIIGEASTADETVKLVEKERPEILILDIGLPQRSGIDVLIELKNRNIPTKVVVLSMYDDETKVKQALIAGSEGYLLKDFAPSEFLAAMDTVISGKKFVPQKFQHVLNQLGSATGTEKATDPLDVLSPREREMFFLLVEGLPNRTIAKKLYISPRTVETHRARVIKKLQLNCNADLIRYAIRNGLVVV